MEMLKAFIHIKVTEQHKFSCFGLYRSRVGKYQKQTWKKSGLYKYTHG